VDHPVTDGVDLGERSGGQDFQGLLDGGLVIHDAKRLLGEYLAFAIDEPEPPVLLPQVRHGPLGQGHLGIAHCVDMELQRG